MKQVFVDSFFWIASANPHDGSHRLAKTLLLSLGKVRLITTDEVLIEFLNALSKNVDLRPPASKMVREILNNPNITVVQQSRNSFMDGLSLYEARSDKTYSLVDCISMRHMRNSAITEILTHDHHFEQEGFVAQMRDAGNS